MNPILIKLQSEADHIRRALDTSAGMYPQRLGNAERAIREAAVEIEQLEERHRKLIADNERCHERIVDLERQLAKKPTLPQSIQDALNSGDGSYKP